jgi:hypothetical protein
MTGDLLTVRGHYSTSPASRPGPPGVARRYGFRSDHIGRVARTPQSLETLLQYHHRILFEVEPTALKERKLIEI